MSAPSGGEADPFASATTAAAAAADWTSADALDSRWSYACTFRAQRDLGCNCATSAWCMRSCHSVLLLPPPVPPAARGRPACSHPHRPRHRSRRRPRCPLSERRERAKQPEVMHSCQLRAHHRPHPRWLRWSCCRPHSRPHHRGSLCPRRASLPMTPVPGRASTHRAASSALWMSCLHRLPLLLLRRPAATAAAERRTSATITAIRPTGAGPMCRRAAPPPTPPRSLPRWPPHRCSPNRLSGASISTTLSRRSRWRTVPSLPSRQISCARVNIQPTISFPRTCFSSSWRSATFTSYSSVAARSPAAVLVCQPPAPTTFPHLCRSLLSVCSLLAAGRHPSSHPGHFHDGRRSDSSAIKTTRLVTLLDHCRQFAHFNSLSSPL